MEQGIRMNTTEEIQELLAIRKQMDELQARYDAILARAHARPVSSAPSLGTVPVESMPAPKPTVSVPVAVPVIKPVETISASQGTVLSPVPVLKAPVATATPVPGPLVPSIPVLKSPSFLPELKPCQDAVKAPAAPAVPVVDAAGLSPLESAIIKVMTEKGLPMGFDAIYAALEKSGAPLPADKPKLVVRKILFNARRFNTLKGGLYSPFVG